MYVFWAFQVALVVKIPHTSEGNIRDVGSIPGSGRSPGGGNGSPLQYSSLENPVDRGAWRATVHRVAQSWTRLKQLSTHAHYIFLCIFLIMNCIYFTFVENRNWFNFSGTDVLF